MSRLTETLIALTGRREDELRPLLQLFGVQTLRAGEYLWHAGDCDPRLYFVERGLVRLFYPLDDGSEFNKAFASEGLFVVGLTAFLKQEPCRFAAQALEETTLQVAAFASFRQRLLDNTAYAGAWLRYMEQHFIRHEEREAELQVNSAAERYRQFQQRHPGLLARLPQYHIASYLGITEVSLSRLRRRMNTERIIN